MVLTVALCVERWMILCIIFWGNVRNRGNCGWEIFGWEVGGREGILETLKSRCYLDINESEGSSFRTTLLLLLLFFFCLCVIMVQRAMINPRSRREEERITNKTLQKRKDNNLKSIMSFIQRNNLVSGTKHTDLP